MQNGVVKWFNDQKGYGFIASGGQDYFVHFKEIRADGYKSLKEGEKVRFNAEASSRGPLAKEVYRGYE